MKRYFNIISLVSALAVLSWSCSEDIMDDINKNVNDPSNVGSHLIITDVMTSTAFRIVGSDLAFYASTYIEHNVGVHGQMYNAEIRSGEPTSSTTYNNSWGSAYENLYNLKLIIEKCSTGGSEEGNFHTLGIAQILTAYNLALLTDVMGDIPWTEALQPGIIFTPKLDSQEDIYADIFTLLNDGIANLSEVRTFPSLGKQDFIYAGDASLWKQFANGLKARYTMRLSHRSPAYADVITFANQSFTSADDQSVFSFENGGVNPFYQFSIDRKALGASQSLHDKLVAFDDPRDDVYFMPYPDTDELIFAPNGSPEQVQGYYSVSAVSTEKSPIYLMSYYELEFIKAEAYARLGDNDSAKIALKKAVTAAFLKENVGLTTDEADEYFTDEVEPRYDSNPISEVMNQKYIALFEAEAIEAYNDYRRLKAMGNNVITLANTASATKFPLRFTYGADDVTTNANVRAAYGDGSYVYTENVWWAGGTR
jgi:hypothetical protein